MTEAERALLTEIAESIEYWAQLIVSETKGQAQFSWAMRPESIKSITTLAKVNGLEKELGDFAYEILYGFAHSILVAFDGGSKLADKFPLEIHTSHGTQLCKYLHELLPDIRAEREEN